MRPIEGTPWFLATALPTKMLTAQRDDVLSTLSLLQIPLVILLVLLQVYAIRQLVSRMKALKANIDLLSSGDADLTRRITIRAEDELGAIGHSVNTFIAYLQNMIGEVTQATGAMASASTTCNARRRIPARSCCVTRLKPIRPSPPSPR